MGGLILGKGSGCHLEGGEDAGLDKVDVGLTRVFRYQVRC